MLRRLVVLFVLLCLAPLAALAISSVRLASEALRTEVEGRVASAAQLGAVAVRGELDGAADLVESYAERPSLVRSLTEPVPRRAELRFQLQELQSARPGIATTFVARLDGRLLEIAPATGAIIGKDSSFRDWYRGVTTSGRTYVSEAYTSQATGKPIVVGIATLVRGPGGRPLAIVVAAYDLKALRAVVNRFSRSQDVALSLTDQRGTVLAAPGSSGTRLVSSHSDRIVEAALRGEEGVVRHDERLVAYRPIAELGWTVTASVPESSAFASVARLRTSVFGATSVLALVLLAGLALLIRSLHQRERAEKEAHRARAEAERVHLENERLASIVAGSEDAILSKTLDGVITSWNAGAERLYGYTPEEAIGQPITLLLPPDKYAEDKEILLQAAGQRLEHYESQRRRKDGTVIDVALTISPIRDAEGRITGASTIARDITERRRAEEEARHARAEADRTHLENERLASIVAGSEDAILSKTLDGVITSWNVGAERLYGYTARDAIGQDIEILIPPERRGEERNILHHVVTGAPLQHYETRRQRKDGTIVDVALTVSPLRDADGRVTGASTIARDISERRRTEEEARRAWAEAERANSAKSEFLSRMSHELRTPMNAVLGFAQLLELETVDERQRESIDQILRAGNHLLALINEVLDVARIEAGKLSLSLEPVDADQALYEAVDLIRPLADERKVTVEVDTGGIEACVRADPQRLKQVLLNLLSNAVKYNRGGGRVSVRLQQQPDGMLRVSVSDTGAGLARSQLERLFSPFERLDADSRPVEGTGLGLALSKGLVEAMHGRIGVDSHVGKGSTFWFELQAVEARSFLEPGPGSCEDDASDAEPVVQAGSVLYIEDNLSNLKLVEQVLTRFPHIELLVAMQGTLGLDLAREHRPDLILLDLHLPDVDGEEVLARLRADPETAPIPVVVLSADAMPRRIERLLASGADDYLPKPLDVGRFMGLLREHLPEYEVTAQAGRVG